MKKALRLLTLLMCMTLLTSCTSCDFMSIFGFEIPAQTDEYGTPIPPEYTKPTEETQTIIKETQKQPEEIIIPYNTDIESEIQLKYYKKFIGNPDDKPPGTPFPKVQFLGQSKNAYCVHVLGGSDPRGTLIGAYFIGGYEFRYKRGRQISVYYGDKLYSLEDAYSKGLVDLNDVASFNAEFKALNPTNYKRYFYEELTENQLKNIGYEKVLIMIQPAYNSKNYTAEDFADVNCVKLEDRSLSGQDNEIHKFYSIFLPDYIDTPEEILSIIRILQNRNDIYSAEPQMFFSANSLPSDYEYYSWKNDDWAMNKINLPQAWDIETGDNTILVGIIDTGVDGMHPDLQNRVNSSLSKSFTRYSSNEIGLSDLHGHGTQAAGIIGAQADNYIGISGVCWDIQIVSLQCNRTPTSDQLDTEAVCLALYYAK